MVLASAHARAGDEPSPDTTDAVVWHDLECGRYDADLVLWRELAQAAGAGASVLDVGAGTGRVALDLAQAGHPVTAIELDAILLNALRRRAHGTGVRALAGDARTFGLCQRDFALCIAPMQTVQLLGGSEERGAFLTRAREHLRPGGLLACAIVADPQPFDCAAGDSGPSAEIARAHGSLYISRATRVRVNRDVVRIERERSVVPAGHAPDARLHARETDVVELDRVTPAQLRREGRAAGLRPEPVRLIGSTEDHVGSTVVILRA